MDYPDYNPQSPVTPLTAAELQQLDTLLQALPADAAMSLDGMDGYLTALLAGPPDSLATLATSDWLPLVWGGDADAGSDAAAAGAAAPFNSKRQRKATTVLLLRHLRHLSEQLRQASTPAAQDARPGQPAQPDQPTQPDQWEPIFSIAEQGAQEWVDACDWCTGFLQAVDLLPGAWAPLWADAALTPVLAPLLLLGGGLDGDEAVATRDDLDAEAVDRLSREVPDAVLALLARRAGPGA